jgi:hypothetical protein
MHLSSVRLDEQETSVERPVMSEAHDETVTGVVGTVLFDGAQMGGFQKFRFGDPGKTCMRPRSV